MPFEIIRDDITKVKADAIVNSANPQPCIGGGAEQAIYAAAGAEKLLAQRKKIGAIAAGQAAYTKAYALSAKYLIHTVAPRWVDGRHGERNVLRACYESTLALAAGLKCESVAFSLIASGSYGFPKGEALNIALSEIGKFLLTHEMRVILVVLDRGALELAEGLVGGIERYIDEHEASVLCDMEYGGRENRGISASMPMPCAMQTETAAPKRGVRTGRVSTKTLDEVVRGRGETFQQRLFRLIDESGMDDVAVYKKANIDRKLFSRIRSKKDYTPKKKTAVAFAIALELDLPTTLDLLARAEIAFSPSNQFDLIVEYFITHRIYDIFEINAALFKYGQPILGE